MPELPEIETIKRGLQGLILNKKIVQIKVLNEKSFRGDPKRVQGWRIADFDRRGKALLVKLERDAEVSGPDDRLNSGGGLLWLLAHMRMTGQLIFIGAPTGVADRATDNLSAVNTPDGRFAAGHPDENFLAEMPSRHTRVIFEFDDGSHLYFNDLRKFGFIALMTETELAQDRFLLSLAPEPWQMTDSQFYEVLQKHAKSPIKSVLLNQSLICGLGNIYADEACYYAGIYPGCLAGLIDQKLAKKLLEGACFVMQKSIDSGGSTMRDYVRADGSKGSYLEKFAQVFRRDGDKCNACGTQILKTRVAGRGTHYCPECQKFGLEHKS